MSVEDVFFGYHYQPKSISMINDVQKPFKDIKMEDLFMSYYTQIQILKSILISLLFNKMS